MNNVLWRFQNGKAKKSFSSQRRYSNGVRVSNGLESNSRTLSVTPEARMRRIVLHSLVVCLLVVPLFTAAQQAPAKQVKVVRVGVAVEQYLDHEIRVNWTSNARSQRDLLVNYLNQHKSGKNSQLRLQAVALTSLSYSGIDAEARDKGCEYIVRVSSGTPILHDQGNLSFHSAEATSRTDSSVPHYEWINYSAGFSLLRASDKTWLAGDSYTQLQPRSTPAMSVMSSVYDAIVKAATP